MVQVYLLFQISSQFHSNVLIFLPTFCNKLKTTKASKLGGSNSWSKCFTCENIQNKVTGVIKNVLQSVKLHSFCFNKRKWGSLPGLLVVVVTMAISNLPTPPRFPMALPGIVTIGVPAQSTSIPVVCPLQSGVSRQTSASCPLLTCSSLGATGEKMILFWERPKFWAYCWILGSPTAGKRSSHSTLFGTLFRICNKNQEENTYSYVRNLSFSG